MELLVDMPITTINVPPTKIKGSINVYQESDLVQYFQELSKTSDSTAVITYEDHILSCKLPIKFGEVLYVTNFKGEKELRNTKSLNFKHEGKLELLEEGNNLRFDVGLTSRLRRHQTHFPTRCKSQIERRFVEDRYLAFPQLDRHQNAESLKEQLIGTTPILRFHMMNDLFYEIKSMPFLITNVVWKEGHLRIEGKEDWFLEVRGFKGIRPNNYYFIHLFDVWDSRFGFAYTFEMLDNRKF